ncbi:glucose transporter GlcP-like [Leguminivora glycinivorella]|uniref:glucose transporter GlcP-like n=1 Tax=Leguminivora glycinivorella TaxID=1035111 RepID=UPI00200C9844|nr:glucose transporter GlcP-like [Leguminivora glycinivorella]XP_048004162.1 glucose transporter GlcP-like [Leguminivora glycinivorella]XP_048004163.1 glucose transporter GlcP-like [Leguminivora glycinivorella]
MTVKDTKEGTIYKQWIIGAIATTPFLTYGLQNGWISPVMGLLQSELSPSGRPLTTSEISLVASGMSIAAISTAVAFGYLADAVGRRVTLMMIATPQIFGFALKLVSAHPACLIVSQVLAGIAAAGSFCVAPAYVKEMAQDSIRGYLASSGILLQSLGMLIMYAMAPYLGYYTLLWVMVWVPILNLAAMFWIPETPAYLVKRGRVEEAIKVMSWLREVDENHKMLERDVSILKNEMLTTDNLPAVSWKSILSNPSSRRAVCISFLVITLLAVGGDYGITAYGSMILDHAGVTFAPEVQALTIPALMTLGSLLSAVTIEKFGRKPLIMVGAVFTGVPLAIMGTALVILQGGGHVPPWIPVVSIGVCLFASGQMMSLPFIIISEIFNVQMRSKVIGVISTYGWSLAGSQTLLFAIITEHFGMQTIFFTFAIVNLFGVIVCGVIMPETKGKTLEQINKELLSRKC